MLIFKLFLERFASSRVSSPLLCLLFPMRMMSMMILMSISNQSMPRSASHLTHNPGLVLFVSFIIVLLFPRNLKKTTIRWINWCESNDWRVLPKLVPVTLNGLFSLVHFQRFRRDLPFHRMIYKRLSWREEPIRICISSACSWQNKSW